MLQEVLFSGDTKTRFLIALILACLLSLPALGQQANRVTTFRRVENSVNEVAPWKRGFASEGSFGGLDCVVTSQLS